MVFPPENLKIGVDSREYARPIQTAIDPPSTKGKPAPGPQDANSLRMEMLNPWGKHLVVAAHNPRINIPCGPYIMCWTDIPCEVTRIVDRASLLVVADTNLARGQNDTVPRRLGLSHALDGLPPQEPGGRAACPR